MIPDEFMWAVGLFEGEGSSDCREPDTHPKVRLQLKSTDEDVIRRFARVVACGSVFGPYINRSRGSKPENNGFNNKDYWVWAVHGAGAENLLRRLLPELGERRRARAFEVLSTAVPGEHVDQLRIQVGVR